METKNRRNGEIKATQVRVIGANGEPLGVMDTAQALSLAADQDLDLVEVSPNQDPPVCKILDFGAYSYQESKRQHEARAKSREQETKEIRLRPSTDEGDLSVKAKHIAEFLERGAKVKVLLRFRGREVAHANLGFAQFERLKERLGDLAVVETPPKMEGRQLLAILGPSKKARELARTHAQQKISAVQAKGAHSDARARKHRAEPSSEHGEHGPQSHEEAGAPASEHAEE